MERIMNIKELEERVEKAKEYGMFKINLEDFENGGEGLWACPVSQEDKDIYESSSAGKEFSVFLLNQAISCFPLNSWGARIKVKTTGKDTRPVVNVGDFIEQLQNAGDDYPSIEEFERLRNRQK